MDKLSLKHEKLTLALASLDQIINALKQITKNKNEKEYKIHRDSEIQRFEYCADLFWKYLKKYLQEKLSLKEVNGPRPVIRECFSMQLISEQEAEASLDMISDRNLTSHMYVEKVAEQISQKIPGHYQLMHSIAQRLG